MKCFQYSFSTG